MPEEIASVRVGSRHPSLVLVVAGEVDLSNAALVRAEIARLAEGAPPPPVLDLAGVEYLDSSGARMLMELRNRFGRDGREMPVVAPASSVVRRVIDLTGLPIVVHDSLERALASLHAED